MHPREKIENKSEETKPLSLAERRDQNATEICQALAKLNRSGLMTENKQLVIDHPEKAMDVAEIVCYLHSCNPDLLRINRDKIAEKLKQYPEAISFIKDVCKIFYTHHKDLPITQGNIDTLLKSARDSVVVLQQKAFVAGATKQSGSASSIHQFFGIHPGNLTGSSLYNNDLADTNALKEVFKFL